MENSKFSIDRFEGKIAVCEELNTKKIVDISVELLPSNCKEVDIIFLKDGKYVKDIETTKKEKEEISSMVNNLFKKK